MKTHIIEAAFATSIDGTSPVLYDGKPQVVFTGRSNVGKSSLINSLIGKKLARSSTRPGKTIRLDFFLIQKTMYFVDLPGYGFARRSKERLDHFRRLIAWYLFSSEVKHKLVVLIVDAYVGVTDLDRESLNLFTTHQLPYVVAANKVDKLKMGERHKKLEEIRTICGSVPVIPYSSYTGEGRDELLTIVFG